MSIVRDWLNGALNHWRRQRDEHLRWQLSRQQHVADLRQAKALAEQTLIAQLKKQSVQLEHELALVATEHDNALAMIKIKAKQDLKDYQQYLQSLDKLKESLRANFAHLPEAVPLTIHHHAKQLLNRMWEEPDPKRKLKIEMDLIQFMTAAHEDSLTALKQEGKALLPQKTLAFIDGDR
ncbi:MAG: hypothetical protein ACU836_04490 [Gammaproteobacteria bacterium]